MNLYFGDGHLGHSNVINFDHRPFEDREQMDQVMIHLWNGRVQKDDDVYVMGDFCYRSNKDPVYYLRQLKGRKHLVIGNHDGKLLENDKAMSYFESVEKMMHVEDLYNGEKVQAQLCHFPLAEWNGMHHGTWHIYAHIHNRKDDTYEFMKMRERALNAGCMINNYTPASFRELVENNERFRNSL